MSRFPRFDRQSLIIRSNQSRTSKCQVSDLLYPSFDSVADSEDPELLQLADKIKCAKRLGKPVIFFISGQVVKYGLGRFVGSLVQQGYITHLATNGSGIIHDWELAYVGATSEDVQQYITDGQFGHWTVPGLLNDIFSRPDIPADEAYGTLVMEQVRRDGVGGDFSLIKACDAANIPLTAHVLIGGDINHQHPNCLACMFSSLYNDFLVFAYTVSLLDGGGVYVNIGSQVTGTEVFLKALSMARNIEAVNRNFPIGEIVTGLLDYVKLPASWRNHDVVDTDAGYYYRPWKTLLVRTVATGGASFCVQGDYRTTLPQLWKAVLQP